jgi:hypothetical protein
MPLLGRVSSFTPRIESETFHAWLSNTAESSVPAVRGQGQGADALLIAAARRGLLLITLTVRRSELEFIVTTWVHSALRRKYGSRGLSNH